MAIGREELLNQARREREGMGRTIQYANPGEWDSPSACEGWRNRDVVAHLAADDFGAAATLAGEPWPELGEFLAAGGARDGNGEIDGDAFNNGTVARRADLPFREVVNEWSAAADSLLVNAAKIDPDEWDSKTIDWFGEDMLVGDFLQTVVADWWTHGEDIRAGVGLAPRGEHWPIYILNDIAVRRLPIVLGETGRDYSGKTLAVDLEGFGEGVWLQALAPGEAAGTRKKANVVIEGNSHAFGLLAARRVSADLYLESGDLVVGGDEEIAFDILENIRPY